jgi:hypothetical protein
MLAAKDEQVKEVHLDLERTGARVSALEQDKLEAEAARLVAEESYLGRIEALEQDKIEAEAARLVAEESYLGRIEVLEQDKIKAEEERLVAEESYRRQIGALEGQVDELRAAQVCVRLCLRGASALAPHHSPPHPLTPHTRLQERDVNFAFLSLAPCLTVRAVS